MKGRKACTALVGVLILGLTIPGIASARFFSWGCDFEGTWIGVQSPETRILTGWMVTVSGKSKFRGTNILEYPTFNAKLFVPDGTGGFVPLYPDADRISGLRGAWMRTGFNTFAYTMTGIAVAADGITPVWIGKLSGNIVLSDDCMSEEITATLETYHPSVSPFDGDVEYTLPLPTHYGYRAYVDLP